MNRVKDHVPYLTVTLAGLGLALAEAGGHQFDEPTSFSLRDRPLLLQLCDEQFQEGCLGHRVLLAVLSRLKSIKIQPFCQPLTKRRKFATNKGHL
ncbi:MAG: hypothetical protein Q7N87_04945 [Candidatus Uhrbacteria bacterium]|nr:hypothetical protein [Candidatus Uhrbacteria bacterium]MDP3793263.1 hypothetical protein [Candidatus Uhrbacteria bacterium]